MPQRFVPMFFKAMLQEEKATHRMLLNIIYGEKHLRDDKPGEGSIRHGHLIINPVNERLEKHRLPSNPSMYSGTLDWHATHLHSPLEALVLRVAREELDKLKAKQRERR